MVLKKELFGMLFLDIETVSQYASYDEMPKNLQQLWEKKSQFWQNTLEASSDYHYKSKAAIYAEFGKIIVISIGYISFEKDQPYIKIKSFAHDNEFQLLTEIAKVIKQFEHEFKDKLIFCGHNIKEFDLPYIARRMMVNQIKIPPCLSKLQKNKPWEQPIKDTLELWRFGDFKHYISLELLATTLNVPISKTNISGADVGKYYYNIQDLEAIKNYCQEDVICTIHLYLRLLQLPSIEHILIQKAN